MKFTTLFLASVFYWTPVAQAQYDSTSYQDTVRQLVRFGLVHLTVTGKLPDGTDIPTIEGTGFLISEDGHVVTAKHVAMTQTRWDQHADKLASMNLTPIAYAQKNITYTGKLRKNDAQSFKLIPIAASETADIAVLKVDTWTDRLQQKSWPILPIISLTGASKTMRVVAWGFPSAEPDEYYYGGDFEATISGIGVIYDGHELASANLRLQPGTSGGPVFNRRGQIVGVVYGGRHLQATGYFTPGNIVQKFLDQLGIVR
jgi:S1-C subfamily serine protease